MNLAFFGRKVQNDSESSKLCLGFESPELFKELFNSHTDASEGAIKSFLVLNKGFSDAGAKQCAAVFKAAIALAKPGDQGYNSDENDEGSKAEVFDIGDYVQWESQGVLQFKTPRRIRAFSEDGEWAFVEGSQTGVPVKELTVEQQPQETRKPPTLPLANAPKDKATEEISLPVGIGDNGEVVFATIRFSGGIKRNLVASLRMLLEAMEKTLPERLTD